jgi:AcrR family transcriptional regulator
VTTSRPRGRRPGRADTRSEILSAALRLFSEVGYEKVSLRAIARAADVDPALIHHYFDSKPELFAEAVLALPVGDPSEVVEQILDGPVEGVGERAVAIMLAAWELPNARERFTAMLRAAVSDPGAQRPLSEYLAKEIYTKVAESLGHANAKQRGQLAVTLFLGFALGRDVLQLPTLSKVPKARLTRALGHAMQAYLADQW